MQYDSYKDSGEQWLGQIPSHWEMVRTKFLWQETDNRSEFGNEQLLSVSQYDGIRESKDESRSESLKGYKIVHKNELVINIMLAWLGGLGVSDLEGIVSPAYCVYKLKRDVNPHFLHYLYKTSTYLAEFARHSTGIVPSRWRMYTDDFGSIWTLLPPKNEQERMVAYLDKETAAIDAAIAQQQKMIDLLNERKQIIIQQAVTKGLDPNAKMKDSGIDWIGQIPEGWEVKPLKRCCENVREKAQQPNATRISLENIESWTGNYIPTESTYDGLGILCKPNDVIFGKLRPYLAKVMLVQKDCEALGDFWVLRPQREILSKYLQIILLSKSLIDLIDSSTYGAKMPRADWNTNSKIMIPLPSIEEQKEIVSKIEMVSEGINKQILLSNNIISLLRERKQIIINEVVTGKIKV